MVVHQQGLLTKQKRKIESLSRQLALTSPMPAATPGMPSLRRALATQAAEYEARIATLQSRVAALTAQLLHIDRSSTSPGPALPTPSPSRHRMPSPGQLITEAGVAAAMAKSVELTQERDALRVEAARLSAESESLQAAKDSAQLYIDALETKIKNLTAAQTENTRIGTTRAELVALRASADASLASAAAAQPHRESALAAAQVTIANLTAELNDAKAKLKAASATSANIELWKEKAATAGRAAAAAKKASARVPSLEAAAEAAQAKVAEFQDWLAAHRLGSLAELSDHLASLSGTASGTGSTNESLKARLARAETELATVTRSAAVHKGMAEAASAESEALRAAMATLESDLSSVLSGNAVPPPSHHQAVIEAQASRISALEASLEETAPLTKSSPKNPVGPAPFKVLHLIDNPQARAEKVSDAAELSALREENTRLRAAAGSGGPVPPLPDPDTSEAGATIKALRKDVTALTRKSEALKKVFKTTIQDFRETMYVLTGWKIDLLEGKKYRLQSMFAETKTDHLLFALTPDGSVQMLSTRYSEDLPAEAKEVLTRFSSIPAFLSQLTLDLFGRQTMLT